MACTDLGSFTRASLLACKLAQIIAGVIILIHVALLPMPSGEGDETMPQGLGQLATCRRQLSHLSLSELVSIFSPWIDVPETFGPAGRKRLFSPLRRTFWLFLSQVLAADPSCRETVRKALAWLALLSGKMASPSTAAYCKARARLPQQDIDALHRQVTQTVEARYAQEHLWYGRRVKILDGTGLSMPDTAANRKVYPLSKRAKPGCGFPLMRLVVLFCLSTGLILQVAKGTLKTAERTLARSLWNSLKPGDILLADRGFCGYADFFYLAQRGLDCVMRNHSRRTKALSVVKKISKADSLILWHKTGRCPKWLTPQQWLDMPGTIKLRQISFCLAIPGFRTRAITVVTTLLDYKAYPKEALADLYGTRWMAELFLRDIKTTMGMDILRCKTPQMVHKEISMYLMAYNLTRALMLEAARRHGVSPFRISFKGTIATVRQWAPILTAAHLDPLSRQHLTETLLEYLATDLLPKRPHRSEPRARKRRQKNYQLLTKPRRIFKESPHRNHHTRSLS
jgi:hypothetical protein